MGLKLIPKSFIQKVVMVGGLSASPYLQMKLKQILDETPGSITMIVPPQPELAVSRGAAACGLRGHIAPESTCRRHIGLERAHPARARLGSMGPSDPEVCWMIRKGDRLSTDFYVTSIIQLPYQPMWPPATTLRIYDCDLDAAPDQASCPGVRCVGQFVCNLGDIDLSKLVFEAVGGQGLYHLQIRVHAALTMTDGAVEFTAYALGQQIGQTKVV
ncbi:hypothetical protein P168DRAFT_131250 [Aspergillus campestris IBT 28561]|uniref:Actin-like ATPase domain-containing protein n=1 Tax=Aspergillus campestris (strain IBT 28561) TaxID=1392248 RepID=A0A2I1D7I5_ASPC2|nr:uncharacterized protein P168DRAFT_131250 [Aspergillus campestris IBT 28561]PKY05835.1 hypothetical protein P168DRAFT_131250 [Aspergillus campestris IBT 28561]